MRTRITQMLNIEFPILAFKPTGRVVGEMVEGFVDVMERPNGLPEEES